MEKLNNSIVLLGLKHCGKSTQGKLLAQKLGVPFYDTDAVIEEIVGMTFRDYYRKKGVAAFTLAEETACKKILEKAGENRVVIATGGGICDNAPALNVLRNFGKFVFLKLDIDYSISRIESKIKINPFGNIENAPAYVMEKNPKNMKQVHEILEEKFKARNLQYENICDVQVAIKDAPIEENFKSICAAV